MKGWPRESKKLRVQDDGRRNTRLMGGFGNACFVRSLHSGFGFPSSLPSGSVDGLTGVCLIIPANAQYAHSLMPVGFMPMIWFLNNPDLLDRDQSFDKFSKVPRLVL